MQPVDQIASIEFRTWAIPGESMTLDDLIACFRLNGTQILDIDRPNNRLLVSYERS